MCYVPMLALHKHTNSSIFLSMAVPLGSDFVKVDSHRRVSIRRLSVFNMGTIQQDL